MTVANAPDRGQALERLLTRLGEHLTQMESGGSVARANHALQALDLCRRIMNQDDGLAALFERITRLDQAGIFAGSDWAEPESLQARFVPVTFQTADPPLATVEILSELRFLAIALGHYRHPAIAAEQAHHFLTQVLAFNLNELFGLAADESQRNQSPKVRALVSRHLDFLARHIGYENILDQVVAEVWRLLRQRPIQVVHVLQMINRIAACLFDPELPVGTTARGAERLVSALYGPTQACQEDPGLEVYRERLTGMDTMGLDTEAQGFSRAMHDTGLVSPYHAAYLRHIVPLGDTELLTRALGLSSTGRDCLLCYRSLCEALVDFCVFPETAQTIYGLACLLERGLLYRSSIGAALWRQMQTPLHHNAVSHLQRIHGQVPDARALLMAGTISALGQPLGLGQGNNPACQSTRALSMWSYTDPDYLLQLLRWAARDDRVVMQFEGFSLNSADLDPGIVSAFAFDLDPLSTVLVPHLDRIYFEMGRLSAGRGEDPHKWINPEFHGWWVQRGFAIAVDIETGNLQEPENFVRTFYALYHPHYNSNTPVVHPQPAGVAVTDAQARFVGWHAIAILRVALDQNNDMRVYFFNPNNDSGQDWGNDVVVSTDGHGEQYGESSLPIAEFTSRLYIFHYDTTDWQLHTQPVPEAEIGAVVGLMRDSWGSDRLGDPA